MKKLCLIRFGNAPDPELSLILALISRNAFTIARTNGVIMTKFETDMSIEACKKELANCGHAFILIDMTEESEHVQVFANDEITMDVLDMGVPVFAMEVERDEPISDDEREAKIFVKIKTRGTGSLTPSEHDFMQNRF